MDYSHYIFILIFFEYSGIFSLSSPKDEDNLFILNRRYAPFQLHHLATMAFHHSPDYPIPSLYASYQRKVLHKYALFPLRNVLVYGKQVQVQFHPDTDWLLRSCGTYEDSIVLEDLDILSGSGPHIF